MPPPRRLRRLAGDNAAWWHAFWQRGTIALHSADGVADYVAENYHYYLYLMAATSRGAFPPKFNGMFWNTAGDLRPWGTQHWFANLSCYYEALFAANRIDLLDPVFAMYSGMYDAAATAAGSNGAARASTFLRPSGTTAWRAAGRHRRRDARPVSAAQALGRAHRAIPRICADRPSALEPLELVGRRPMGQRRVGADRAPSAPFGPVTHILGTTAKVAYLYWRRYEFTQDVRGCAIARIR